MSPRRIELVWVPFFWAAVGLGLGAGFGLGGGLFVVPVGAWFVAAGRVHGHVQLIGWAGLMVLGVGFHFLPRLRGRPLAHAEHARTVLWLLVGGLVLRIVTEPLAAVADGVPQVVLNGGMVLSGVLELAGVTVAIWLLVLTFRGSPPVHSRAGLQQVLPLLATAFAGLWLTELANLVSVSGADTRVANLADRVAVLLALYAFLIPVSVGMGARLFPLHFAARPIDERALRAGLLFLVGGLALRLAGELATIPLLTATGLVGLAVGLGLFVIGLRVYGSRRTVPGRRAAWYTDAAQWHGLTATAWLVLDALLLVLSAAAIVGGRTQGPAADAEPHVLGAGFVTLLILGEGAKLLPGFAVRPMRNERLVWATLGLGNMAALLRVGPVLVTGLLSGPTAQAALGSAGLAGVLAIAAFALNLGWLRPPAVESR